MDVNNFRDNDGNPAGGTASGVGFNITFQDGPMGQGPNKKFQNGAMVEDLLQVCLQRLRFFQESKLQCRQNSIAITKIEEAIHWLEDRTRDRESRDVKGTNKV